MAARTLPHPLPTQQAMLQGVALARWGTWLWLTATTVIQRDDLIHPSVAVGAVLVSGLWATAGTVLLRVRSGVLLQGRWAIGELAIAWVLLVVDGYAFEFGHTDGGGQNLAATWPLVALLCVATSRPPSVSVVGAVAVASGRVVGALANGEAWPRNPDRLVSFLATLVYYATAALLWSLVTERLRVVETEVADRRARDQVARTLHDGVLQTLALVERRSASTDPELAATARASDRELRAWLYGVGVADQRSFEARVRQRAEAVAAGYDLPITVNVLAEVEPRPEVTDAVVGALGEALTNAAKHAGATKVVVFVDVEEDGSVFASVRDDGKGLDPVLARQAGRGIVRSIDERLATVGGRAELVSGSGADSGTEVRVWAR
ncbi:MAG: sensor histidine kinase [Acidimicrobiales bacterium]